MERLTTNKNVSEMGMYELAHNACYNKDRHARYRDYEMDMDARDFARNLMTTLMNEDMSLDDDSFDEEIMENLMYDPFSDVRGLIALFYRNLWAMADLRERLKEYEDAEKKSLLKWLPCNIGDTIYTIEPRFYNYSHHEGVQKGKVIGFECENSGRWVFWARMADDNKNSANAYEFDNVGKTVFFTKEEAEKALKQMTKCCGNCKHYSYEVCCNMNSGFTGDLRKEYSVCEEWEGENENDGERSEII